MRAFNLQGLCDTCREGHVGDTASASFTPNGKLYAYSGNTLDAPRRSRSNLSR
jgi:hypothetical protein